MATGTLHTPYGKPLLFTQSAARQEIGFRRYGLASALVIQHPRGARVPGYCGPWPITSDFREFMFSAGSTACDVFKTNRVPPLFAVAGAGIGALYILLDAVSHQRRYRGAMVFSDYD